MSFSHSIILIFRKIGKPVYQLSELRPLSLTLRPESGVHQVGHPFKYYIYILLLKNLIIIFIFFRPAVRGVLLNIQHNKEELHIFLYFYKLNVTQYDICGSSDPPGFAFKSNLDISIHGHFPPLFIHKSKRANQIFQIFKIIRIACFPVNLQILYSLRQWMSIYQSLRKSCLLFKKPKIKQLCGGGKDKSRFKSPRSFEVY